MTGTRVIVASHGTYHHEINCEQYLPYYLSKDDDPSDEGDTRCRFYPEDRNAKQCTIKPNGSHCWCFKKNGNYVLTRPDLNDPSRTPTRIRI